jgi:hypothetical protein
MKTLDLTYQGIWTTKRIGDNNLPSEGGRGIKLLLCRKGRTFGEE